MSQETSDDDPSSADDKDVSSTEDNGDDLSTSNTVSDYNAPADGDNISSSENSSGDTSSVGIDEEVLTVADIEDDNSLINEVTTLRPHNERPKISIDLVRNSTIASKLPGFLAQMCAANQELEKEKSAGTLVDRRIEIDETDGTVEGDQHIEMNLGLGVLEERTYGTSTTSESGSSSEDDDCDIMEKLLGSKRKHRSEDGSEVATKKSKIQEV